MTSETSCEEKQAPASASAGSIFLHCTAGVLLVGLAIAVGIMAVPIMAWAWHGAGMVYGFAVLHLGNAWMLPVAGFALAVWNVCVNCRIPYSKTMKAMLPQQRRAYARLEWAAAFAGVWGWLLVATLFAPLAANHVTAKDIAEAPWQAYPAISDGTLPVQAFDESDLVGRIAFTAGVSGRISRDGKTIFIEAEHVAPLDCVRLGAVKGGTLEAVNGEPVSGNLPAQCGHFLNTLTFAFAVPAYRDGT